jgi:hypothetical protein
VSAYGSISRIYRHPAFHAVTLRKTAVFSSCFSSLRTNGGVFEEEDQKLTGIRFAYLLGSRSLNRGENNGT